MAETAPVDAAVDIVGSPEVSLRVASPTGEAVLFVKLYDVDSSGRATLSNGLIAPCGSTICRPTSPTPTRSP